MNIDKNIAEQIIKIAENAGSIIMKYYKTSPEVIRKSDGSPVTAADKRSEEYIIYELKNIWSDIPAIGEESVPGLSKDIDLLAPHWLIDPLDGTKRRIYSKYCAYRGRISGFWNNTRSGAQSYICGWKQNSRIV